MKKIVISLLGILLVFSICILSCSSQERNLSKETALPKVKQVLPRFFKKGPYLQNVTRQSIVIMWETDQLSDSRVDYGLTESYGQYVYDPELVTIHEVKITGLNVETVYHYRISSASLMSQDYLFKTAPNKQTPFRFAVWGDNRAPTSSDMPRHLVDCISVLRPDLVISTGDVVEEGFEYERWSKEYFNPIRDLAVSTPTYISIGNHENQAHWFDDFVSQPGNEHYFSFNYGNSHFIFLDSNQSCAPGTDQYEWLVKDLASETCKEATFRFVFFHHPPYSKHWGGENRMRKYVVPLIEKGKVDICFNGHVHNYERGCSLNKKVGSSIHYVITGGGGAPLSDEKIMIDWPNIEVYLPGLYNFCIIEVNGASLSFRAYSVISIDDTRRYSPFQGKIIDQFTITKKNGKSSPSVFSGTFKLLFTAKGGGQGLASDGDYFYFGHNNGKGVDGTIYKIDYTGAKKTSFRGPPHCAGGDWRENNNTILFSSGGKEPVEIWEIDKSNGAKIRSWDFTDLDYGEGALVTWKKGNTIYLFTSDYNTSNFTIREVAINDDGTYKLGEVWSHTSLGVPQGLDYKDGYLYYLTNKKLYQLKLNVDGGITIENQWNAPPGETEGLTWDGQNWYAGDVKRNIWKFTFNGSSIK